MSNQSEREHQIFMLEAASAASEDDPDFGRLMTRLQLPEDYQGLAYTTLQRGRWRNSANPMRTLRTSILRAALASGERQPARNRRERSGWGDRDIEDLSHEAELSSAFRGDDQVWRPGGGREATRDALYDHKHSLETIIGRHVPSDLRILVEPEDDLDRDLGAEARELPDWEKIAVRSGLDAWETKALLLMNEALTLYRALSCFSNADEMRQLEAAWKRLTRSKFAKVRAVLV